MTRSIALDQFFTNRGLLSRSLGFEDNGEDVSIACFTEKQKFRMKPDGDFESDQLETFIDQVTIRPNTILHIFVRFYRKFILPSLLRVSH
jgi:hypothetical protein